MDLIKRQRAKFTASITIISAIFLLALLGGFFGITCVSNDVTVRAALSRALNSPESYNESSSQAMKCAFIFINNNGKIVVFDKEYMARYGDSTDDIIEKAYVTVEGKFTYGKNSFVCASKSYDAGTLIALLDRTYYKEALQETGLQIGLLYVLSVALCALLGFLSSARLLYPVSESFKKQRDLIANASHELKTPLTVISTNLSVLKSEPQSTVESNEEWIKNIEAQISRMQGLIQNMLELSKLEHAELPKELVDFSVIAEGACLSFEPICFEKEVRLVTNINESINVMGDKAALERLVTILLDNAIKYCSEKGKVGVNLTCDQKKAKLSVMNTGEAVSKEEAQHVFDRFYRTDGARRNEDKQSFGLGLSIAAATVQAHGGTITCQGIQGKGTVFTVLLPIAKMKKSKK